jgi:hypothetical protein
MSEDQQLGFSFQVAATWWNQSMKQTAQDEVHEREQHRVPPRQADESAMLVDDAAQGRGNDFCTPQRETPKELLAALA